MASGIHQIQVSYVPHEDRILVNIYTQDDRLFRAFFSRRFLQNFWGPLVKAYGDNAAALTDGSEATASLMVHSQFKHNLTKANMGKAEQPMQPLNAENTQYSYPLGEAPIVANTAVFTSTNTGARTIQILPLKGQGVNVSLNDGLLTPFIQMLYDAHNTADWKLDLRLPGHTKIKPKLPSLLS